MTPHFVRPHVAVERQPIGSSQQRGIPKLCVKTSDRAGNGGKFGQGEANHLVAAGSATNFFDEEEPICAPMSRCPSVHLRRVLATERSKQTVGGNFSCKYAKFPGPFSSLGNFGSDLQHIVSAVAGTTGEKGLAKEAPCRCRAQAEPGGFQGRPWGIWRTCPGLISELVANRFKARISSTEAETPRFLRVREIWARVSPDFTVYVVFWVD